MDVSDVQVKTLNADARPAFWLRDVEGADLFRIRVPDDGAQAFSLSNVKGIRCLGSAQIHDQAFESAVSLSI